MDRRSALIALLLLAITYCVAQDIIITRDAQKIVAKITEVSKTEIKYKEADNPDGPMFVLATGDISSVIYSNGKVSLYDMTSQSSEVDITATSANETAPTKDVEKLQPKTKNISIENASLKISASEEADNSATIVLRNGTNIQCRLTQMGKEQVCYVSDNDEDCVSTKELVEIVFSNGQVKHYYATK